MGEGRSVARAEQRVREGRMSMRAYQQFARSKGYIPARSRAQLG